MKKVVKKEVNQEFKKTIKQLIGEFGGLNKFISKGDTVFLKPNFNTADEFPGSSSIDFLKAVSELVYESGAKSVIIGDSSTIYIGTEEIIKEKGVRELENIGIPLKVYNLDKQKFITKKIPNAQYLSKVSVPKILYEADKLIYLPCLKTHSWAQFTGSLKLSVGIMKYLQRIPLHATNLQEKIGELNKIIHPDLTIMDARKCFINQGPAQGEVKKPNLLLASTKRIPLDIEGIKIIQSFEGNSLQGIVPEELPQIKSAKQIGIEE